MNKIFIKSFIILPVLLFAGLVYFAGCSNNVTDSLYSGSSAVSTGGTPKINSVNPPGEALAGVTQGQITGENFLSDTSAVKVYFGKQPGTIISASPTQLSVIPPNVSGALKIKVTTNVAESFSNTYDYTLSPAAQDYYPDATDKTTIPMSIIFDNTGTLYVSNASKGVFRVPPDSVSTLYSSKGGETFWTSMRFGSGGVLYAARNNQAIFMIPASGARNTPWVVLSPSSLKLSQIDFDPNGNMWAAGNNSSIYRIKPDKSYTPFPFDYNVTAMRVFVDGGTAYLYAAAQKNNSTTIIRLPIDSNGDLGSPETYFDFSAQYGTDHLVNDMTFSADGEMFLATDMTSPLVYVNTDKSSGSLYQSVLLNSPALSFAWGQGNFLYYVRAQQTDATGAVTVAQTVIKLNLLKPGAPYYGL